MSWSFYAPEYTMRAAANDGKLFVPLDFRTSVGKTFSMTHMALKAQLPTVCAYEEDEFSSNNQSDWHDGRLNAPERRGLVSRFQRGLHQTTFGGLHRRACPLEPHT